MNAPHQPLIVLAAGGTGGHVFPAEALAAELAGRGCRLALITDRRGGSFNGGARTIDTYRVRAGGVAGKGFFARVRSALELAVGTLQARSLLSRLSPDAIVGFGGYASVPTMLAARFTGRTCALHEQNAVLGRANRLFASKVGRIALSFEKSRSLPAEFADRVTHTGMPVRAAVSAAREQSYPTLAADGPLRLLVLGGSQGARVLSQVVPAAVGLLDQGYRSRLEIAQQCRPEDLDEVIKAYRDLDVKVDLATFFDDVPERMAASHLLIGRSGASTVAEVLAVGRPAIFVPYPHAVDDHQSANAHAVDECGAGWLMPEDAFTPETLAGRLTSLFSVPATLENAAACALSAGHADAASRLGDMILDMLTPNGVTDSGRAAS